MKERETDPLIEVVCYPTGWTVCVTVNVVVNETYSYRDLKDRSDQRHVTKVEAVREAREWSAALEIPLHSSIPREVS